MASLAIARSSVISVINYKNIPTSSNLTGECNFSYILVKEIHEYHYILHSSNEMLEQFLFILIQFSVHHVQHEVASYYMNNAISNTVHQKNKFTH